MTQRIHRQLYSDFNWSHGPEQRKDYSVNFWWPERWCDVGKAVAIGYRSNKRALSEYDDYIHRFGPGVRVYMGEGSSYGGQPVDLYQTPIVQLSFLGRALDLQLSKQRKMTWYDSNTFLGWNQPLRTLLIASPSSYPILIAGGRLKVTSRGIEN